MAIANVQPTIHSARPVSIASVLSPVALVRTLWKHRDLTAQFTWRLFAARYRGTQLGLFWAMLFPLTQLAVFVLVFTYVFKLRAWDGRELSGPLEYAVILFCGIVVYNVFAEGSSRSCSLVIDNPNFVKKVVFPVEILPVASLLSGLILAGFSLVLVLLGAFFVVKQASWTVVLLPVVVVPLLMLALGLGWFLAALTVFVRDTANVAGILIGQILFYLSPVLYSTSHLPPEIRWLANLNPLTGVIEGARSVVLFGRQPDWFALAISLVVGVVAMQLGFAFFMKSKRGFGDVL